MERPRTEEFDSAPGRPEGPGDRLCRRLESLNSTIDAVSGPFERCRGSGGNSIGSARHGDGHEEIARAFGYQRRIQCTQSAGLPQGTVRFDLTILVH